MLTKTLASDSNKMIRFLWFFEIARLFLKPALRYRLDTSIDAIFGDGFIYILFRLRLLFRPKSEQVMYARFYQALRETVSRCGKAKAPSKMRYGDTGAMFPNSILY